MSNLVFDLSDTAGRFAVRFGGDRIMFETHHLTADERANLKRVILEIANAAWHEGHAAGMVEGG